MHIFVLKYICCYNKHFCSEAYITVKVFMLGLLRFPYNFHEYMTLSDESIWIVNTWHPITNSTNFSAHVLPRYLLWFGSFPFTGGHLTVMSIMFMCLYHLFFVTSVTILMLLLLLFFNIFIVKMDTSWIKNKKLIHSMEDKDSFFYLQKNKWPILQNNITC